jgi:hypothetical protein
MICTGTVRERERENERDRDIPSPLKEEPVGVDIVEMAMVTAWVR